MKRIGILLALALLLTAPARAQTVQQSGTVTPGHVGCWTTNGVLQDCGSVAFPFATSLGFIGQGNVLCVDSAPTTGPYNQLCLGNTSNNGTITFNNLGGQAPGTLNISVNGAASSPLGVIGIGSTPVTSGTSSQCLYVNGAVVGNQPCAGLLTPVIAVVRSTAAATVTANATGDYFLCLDPASNAITVNLPASPAIGLSYLIKDCTGNAAINNIKVQPASGNIDGAAFYTVNGAYQSIAVTYTGAQWSLN